MTPVYRIVFNMQNAQPFVMQTKSAKKAEKIRSTYSNFVLKGGDNTYFEVEDDEGGTICIDLICVAGVLIQEGQLQEQEQVVNQDLTQAAAEAVAEYEQKEKPRARSVKKG